MKPPSHSYLPEIDGLRAVAVVAVVIFHAFPSALPGGFVGVDIFFVISGYLITGLLRAEWQAKGAVDIAAFYARRARRILPALVTLVLCTMGAVALLLDRAAMHEATSSAAASLLFAANAYFQTTTGGYFDPSTDKLPLLHLWSLGVEEQFYLVWPLVLAALLARRPNAAAKIVTGAALASILLAAGLCLTDPNAAFYLMPARFWELAIGGLIAMGTGARRGVAVAWCGAALMAVAICLPTRGLAAVNVVLGTGGAALLIWTVHGRGALGPVGAALRSRPAVFLGLISYSLYLWHWPLLAIARSMLPGEVPPMLLANLCVVAVVLAWLSYRFIEMPFRRPNPKTPNKRLVAASLLSCISLSSLAWSMANQTMPLPAPKVVSLADSVRNDLPPDPLQCRFTFRDNFDIFPKSKCGRSNDAPAVVIWGDSHAWAMGPFADEIAQHEGRKVLSLTRDACPPAIGYDSTPSRPLESEKCRTFNDLAIAQIRKRDIVILVGNWSPYPNPQDLLEGIDRSVRQVSELASKVLILGPSPILLGAAPSCIAANDLGACELSRTRFDAQVKQYEVGIKSIAKSRSNVRYVSRADFFCTATTCPATRDGYGLYWDAHHATTTAAKAFGEYFLMHQ